MGYFAWELLKKILFAAAVATGFGMLIYAIMYLITTFHQV